jgi:hypothetical protein
MAWLRRHSTPETSMNRTSAILAMAVALTTLAPLAAAAPRKPAAANAHLGESFQVEAMANPGFKAAYLAALGPLKREAWLVRMNGPGDQKIVTVAGGTFTQVAVCKDHDCEGNAMLLVYRPQPQTLWGIVAVQGRMTLIGNPPPVAVPELRRLFKARWQ